MRRLVHVLPLCALVACQASPLSGVRTSFSLTSVLEATTPAVAAKRAPASPSPPSPTTDPATPSLASRLLHGRTLAFGMAVQNVDVQAYRFGGTAAVASARSDGTGQFGLDLAPTPVVAGELIKLVATTMGRSYVTVAKAPPSPGPAALRDLMSDEIDIQLDQATTLAFRLLAPRLKGFGLISASSKGDGSTDDLLAAFQALVMGIGLATTKLETTPGDPFWDASLSGWQPVDDTLLPDSPATELAGTDHALGPLFSAAALAAAQGIGGLWKQGGALPPDATLGYLIFGNVVAPTIEGLGRSGGGSGGGGSPTQPAGIALSSVAVPDTWVAGPALQRGRVGPVAGVYLGRLFVIEGDHAPSLETLADTTWSLDTSYDATTQSDLGPNDLMQGGQSLMVGGVTDAGIFLAGGTNSNWPALVAFSGLMPTVVSSQGYLGVRAAASGCVTDASGRDELLLAGGLETDGSATSWLRKLDLADGQLTFEAPPPRALAGSAGVVLGNQLHVLGGYVPAALGSLTPAVASHQVYDPVAETWRSDADGAAGPANPPLAVHSAAAAVLNGKLYLAGGVGPDGSVSNQLSVYDPATNAWQSLGPMPTARALLALVAFQGGLWAIGGINAAGIATTAVEVYQP